MVHHYPHQTVLASHHVGNYLGVERVPPNNWQIAQSEPVKTWLDLAPLC